MEESRLHRLTTLFERALAVPSTQRREFLEKACGDDTALREELSTLLEAHASSTGYFDDLAARIVSPAYAAVIGSARSPDDATLLSQLQSALGEAYRVERELGGGAMSRVVLAEETRLGRKVVIKVLPPEMAATVSAERFRREIQLAAQLQHPHIVALLTSDTADSFLYYTMPYVAGESLRARLAREGSLSVADASRIWRDMLDALAYAHSLGVIHRDIKPANILLSGRNAVVADFGIARAIQAAAGDGEATATGLTIGTPAYMAPEQVTGDRGADHRVDVYAAGLVMYEMLEGRSPFAGGSARELLLARLTQDVQPVRREDCPRELVALVSRCLARDPGDRPRSAEAVLGELEGIGGQPSTTAPEAVAAQRHPPDTGGRLQRKARSAPPPFRRWVAFAVAAVVVAAAILGVSRLTAPRTERAALGADAGPSIAVLPLANLGTNPGDDALTDGMTEELTATLARVRDLRVIGSTSAHALKNRGLDARQIAETLRVSHILEGGLQRVGSRLRMQIRLVDATDGSSRWSHSYDREMDDVFAVQEDIARTVARELDLRVVGAARRGSVRRRHYPNLAAYEWYLRGMDLRTNRAADRAEYFNRAIEIDSNFAAAHAALAHVYLLVAGDAPGDYREWDARAEQAALRAVARDDSLAEAHVALGWVHIANRNWAAAEAELKKAAALDPRAPRTYDGLARVYLFTGRPTEQMGAARRGMEIDPFSEHAIRDMAFALNVNGRCDETLRLLQPLKSLDPPFPPAGIIRGLCLARMEQWSDAVAEFRWTTENTGGRAALAFLGYALARGGQVDEAKAILSDMLAGRRHSHGSFGIAIVYAGLRDYDQAFAWLDKAVDENSWRVYIMDPALEDLHRDPRFQHFQRRIGL